MRFAEALSLTSLGVGIGVVVDVHNPIKPVEDLFNLTFETSDLVWVFAAVAFLSSASLAPRKS